MSHQHQSLLICYRYDALDRLSSHRQLDNAHCQRFYCASHLVTKVQGDEHISIVQHGDQLLSQRHRRDSEVASTLVATDRQRSVLNTLHANLPRTIGYSPYGHRVFESNLSSLLGFNGQRPEPVTGHYLLGNGYRAFNPVLMRFNSSDDMSPFGKGGLNSYVYCRGDPINRSDPTGHFTPPVSPLFSRFSSLVESIELGVRLKPVTNVMKLAPGILSFEDMSKGGLRLTLQAHGGAGKVNGNLTALDLYLLAKSKGISFERFESVRLVMCASAEAAKNQFGKSYSVGEVFNALAKRSVKAYKEKVGSVNTHSEFKTLEVGETYAGPFYFGVAKTRKALENFNAQYAPVTFHKVKREAADIRQI